MHALLNIPFTLASFNVKHQVLSLERAIEMGDLYIYEAPFFFKH